jgi:4-hydroxybenzoate polyprenyltransferase
VIGRALAFIRFSHTVFALPFAVGSMVVAAGGWPGWRLAGLVVLATVCARTAAMAFNRVADWEIDRRNPRTEGRHRLVPKGVGVLMVVAGAAGFVETAWLINPLCFKLSPVALALVLFYSLTKRFTAGSHFFLGLALAVAPVGAWLAVTGAFALAPLVLAGAVLLWVAGFDVIYATQDAAFDREAGLHSLVVRLGEARALRWAGRLHGAMFVGLAAFGVAAGLGPVYFAGLLPVAGALVYEHRVVAAGRDAAAINAAFFKSNALVSFVFVAAVALDVALR